MNLHEYQSRQLLTSYNIPVPPGKEAYSIEEALQNANSLGGNSWVVKAQVHAGGRGKVGGVRIAHGVDELTSITDELLGKRLVTKQSAPTGQPVHCVLISTLSEIKSELYLSIVLDRAQRRIVIMASAEGGVYIEEVAAKKPKKIIYINIDPVLGLQGHQSRRVGFALNLNESQRKQFSAILHRLYAMYIEKDLSLVEINPLIIDKSDQLLALDAKIKVDDNALFRQSELSKWYDPSQEDERENIAKRHDLNYVKLDGDIACMVNGAGLAMATMDIIKLHGKEPANFLDVGGGADAERVTEAFKLIVSDSNVTAILINIFGGIVRCDLIAAGIIKAVKEVGVHIPVIARLAGTNVDEGKKALADSDLTIISATDLEDAAKKAVAAATGE